MKSTALISKYNPAHRIENKYSKDEWTSFYDIGQPFADGILTKSQYKLVEDRYVHCILDLANLCGVRSFRIRNLEIYHRNLRWIENQKIEYSEAETFVRSCLKNHYWGRLVGRNFELKFGHDYYLFIKSSLPRKELSIIVSRYSLYINDFIE